MTLLETYGDAPVFEMGIVEYLSIPMKLRFTLSRSGITCLVILQTISREQAVEFYWIIIYDGWQYLRPFNCVQSNG